MKRRFKIVGNWKLNKGIEDSLALAHSIADKTTPFHLIDIGVAPVALSLHALSKSLADSHLKVGAQNSFHKNQGAFTGELSPTLLKDAGASFCIVGHSERRQIFHESDDETGLRAKACLEADMDIIVCCGETEEQRESGQTLTVVEKQLSSVFALLPKDTGGRLTVAYEPVWAIGTGKTATPQTAQDAHSAIRSLLSRFFTNQAKSIAIQYGGSVKPQNARELLAQPDIDGALVGGASLKSYDFAAICEIAENLS